MVQKMMVLKTWAVLTLLFHLGAANRRIGCLIDQSICEEQEICVDDDRVGTCLEREAYVMDGIPAEGLAQEKEPMLVAPVLADQEAESLIRCMLSYAALVQHYELDYDPKFCYSDNAEQKLQAIHEVAGYAEELAEQDGSRDEYLAGLAQGGPGYSSTDFVDEFDPRATDYVAAQSTSDLEAFQQPSMDDSMGPADLPAEIYIPMERSIKPVPVEGDEDLFAAAYRMNSPDEQESSVNKKDFEEIGIIDQGTGHKEHKIQTRLPDFRTVTLAPWYDYEVQQIPAIAPETSKVSFLHWIENDRVYIRFNQSLPDANTVEELLKFLSITVGTHKNVTFDKIDVQKNEISFDVIDRTDERAARFPTNLRSPPKKVDAADVAEETYQLMRKSPIWVNELQVVETGVSRGGKRYPIGARNDQALFLPIFAVSLLLLSSIVIGLLLYIYRSRKKKGKSFFGFNPSLGHKVVKDYEELCRRHMSGKVTIPEPLRGVMGTLAQRLGSQTSEPSPPPHTRSTNSSASSWAEEPVQTNMDVSTGHMILSYLDDHIKNTERLQREWQAIENYKADQWSTTAAMAPENEGKNRSTILPYDHYRVVLSTSKSQTGTDYINASLICDHDPRCPVYVAAEAPTAYTAPDFWQMVWEQNSVVIVNLTKLMENDQEKCYQYWPENKSQLYESFEVHLVSEHIWCEDYLVRSFYLKNLKTQETRTVTQFHYLSWPEDKVPTSAKSLLEFRRKVNKSYRAQGSPIVIHCSDGAGRTGTYILIDMALNRINKGVKEVDIAASLEHLRDQRMGMVRTIEQFSFALSSIAEEVQAMVKAVPMNQ